MNHDPYCDSELCGPAKIPGRALVLNRQRYQSILKHLHRGEDAIELAEQEKHYRNYLKEASRAMTNQWENSFERIRDRKTQEFMKREQDKIIDGDRHLKELKENDERKRMEHVNKAQNLIRRLKVGPKQLDRAYVLSEVLRGQEIQRNINAEMEKNRKEKEQAEGKEILKQAEQWLLEQQTSNCDAKKRNDEYKHEIYEYVQEHERSRAEKAKKRSEAERQVREQADKELKQQIEKERAILQRKKEAMRRNALEAMRMAEQRRLRDKMEDELENNIIAIFAKGKCNILELKKQKEREMQQEKIACREEIANIITAESQRKTSTNDASFKKAESEIEKKLDKREQDRIDHDKKMKALRIQQHLEDIEKDKRKKADKLEELRWAVANRIKNEEVNEDFVKSQKRYQCNKIHETRCILVKQMAENEKKRKEEREEDLSFLNSEYVDDDKYFFEYANQLIEDAKAKGRPILPLMKAIDQYKKDNFSNDPKQVPPHLESNVPIEHPCSFEDAQPKVIRNIDQAPIIKYELDELKKLNPFPQKTRSNTTLWR